LIRRNQQPTYFNSTDRTAITYRGGSNVVEPPIRTQLATAAPELVVPVRFMPSWEGKNVYEGDYWSSTTREVVHHESFLERECLMTADFDPSIVPFSWQPFELKWPLGTKGHRSNVPDYFSG
jgi:hypothetical protein